MRVPDCRMKRVNRRMEVRSRKINIGKKVEE